MVFIILEETSGSVRHEITDVQAHCDEQSISRGLDVAIKRISPEVGSCDMAEWHLFLEIQKEIFALGDELWINGEISQQLDR